MLICAGAVGPLPPKSLNTLGTPITIREMIDAVSVYLLLSGKVGTCKLLTGSRFLLWGSELFRPWGYTIRIWGFLTAKSLANVAASTLSSRQRPNTASFSPMAGGYDGSYG